MFGTGTDWVQLTWSALGPGEVVIRVGDRIEHVVTDGGPGSRVVTDLPAGTELEVRVDGPGVGSGGAHQLVARTLTPPPGEELLRLATVSDVHIGSHTTGFLHTIAEIPEPDVPHTVRCLKAARSEALAWGAQHLVVKGDLVDVSHQANWDRAGRVLGGLPIPVDVLPGNHERSKTGDVDPAAGAAAAGLRLVDDFAIIDRDGVRLIMADTTRPRTDVGRITDVAHHIVDAAGSTTTPVLVALHHQLMRWPVPTYIPLGIPRPQARRFLGALGDANPRTLVTSGHTHRHRAHAHGPVLVTEVGSTKDFPGTWAGYQIHEGGIVQTVRRIREPSVIRWTDHTRRAAVGVWAAWSPGRLDHRCFSTTW